MHPLPKSIRLTPFRTFHYIICEYLRNVIKSTGDFFQIKKVRYLPHKCRYLSLQLYYFLCKGCKNNSLNGVHAVFCFLEYNGSLAFEYLIGNLEGIKTEFFTHFLADLSFKIVE